LLFLEAIRWVGKFQDVGHTVKKKKIKFIVGGVIIAVAAVYLVYAGVRGNLVYYVTPSELLAKGEQMYNKGIRLSGRIEDGSINWDAGKLDLRFKITDGKETIPVVYHGIVPDTFKYGVEVVVEGKLNPEHTFQAAKLLAKCPSKYEPQTE
jgi:cytochrome c-type biogenesis protein CcmE